jgi:hypothetical protein
MTVDERVRAGVGRGGFLVDAASAHHVAAAFCQAPSAPHDPVVRAAYTALGEQAQRWFAHLTGPASEVPVRVEFTRNPEPYADAAELTDSVRTKGLLEVGSVSFDNDRRHPLLDHSPGGAHDQLRAVHDIVSHGLLGHDFGRDGEFSAWLVESQIYGGLARWALATELHAHHSVRWTTGTVAPYKAVLLPLSVVKASARARRSRREA